MIGELILLAELLQPSDGVSRVVRPTPVGISQALTAAVYPEGWDADKIVITLDPANVSKKLSVACNANHSNSSWNRT